MVITGVKYPKSKWDFQTRFREDSLFLERLYRNPTKLSFRASPTSYQVRGRLVGRDPESRKVAENQIILDPGSHPAPRDLAGMTYYDTASDGDGQRY